MSNGFFIIAAIASGSYMEEEVRVAAAEGIPTPAPAAVAPCAVVAEAAEFDNDAFGDARDIAIAVLGERLKLR